MIVDSPLVIEQARGQDKRIIEAGDAQLSLPPVLHSTMELVQPTLFTPGALTVVRVGSMTHITTSRTNQAAASTVFMTLQPGIYNIQLFLSCRFNYTTLPNATPDVSIRLVNAGGSIVTPLAFYAATGMSPALPVQLEVNLIDQTTVELRTELNGVGQTVDALAYCNAVRRL